MNLIVALSRRLALGERMFARALVLALVGLVAINVFMRYVFGRPIIFAEELAAVMLVWLTFVAASLSFHLRAQIAVTLLTDMLAPPIRETIERILSALMAAAFLLLFWTSVVWLHSPSVSFEQIITTGWAKWPFFLIIPIFTLTSSIHMLAHAVERAEGRQ